MLHVTKRKTIATFILFSNWNDSEIYFSIHTDKFSQLHANKKNDPRRLLLIKLSEKAPPLDLMRAKFRVLLSSSVPYCRNVQGVSEGPVIDKLSPLLMVLRLRDIWIKNAASTSGLYLKNRNVTVTFCDRKPGTER